MSLTMCSDVALQTKLALRQIYDEMTAVRSSALSLPKLLSIIEGLKPSQQRLMQSLLMNLPGKIRQDLGCYFYIFKIMGRAQSLQNPSLETSSPHDILDQWHVLEASALFSVYNKRHMPRPNDHHTFECHIVHYLFGIQTPRMACTTNELKKNTNERLQEMLTLLRKDVTWPSGHLCHSLIVQYLEGNYGRRFSPPLLENAMGSRFNLSPSCPQGFILFAQLDSDGTCIHGYETALGSYIISVDSKSTLYQAGTLIAPFSITRVNPFIRRIQATGWLTIPPIRPLKWGVPILDGWASIITAHVTKPRAARWWKIPSLRCLDKGCNRSCPSGLHPRICSEELRLDDFRLAQSSFHTIIKSELTKWESNLESELRQLEVEHGGCSCAFCVPS